MDEKKLARLNEMFLEIAAHPDMKHRRYDAYINTLVKNIMNALKVERVSIWRFDSEADVLNIANEFHVRTLPVEKIRSISQEDAPEYIVRLIKRVVTASLETVKIVNGLPKLEKET